MAIGDDSPAFQPPVNSVPANGKDPMIVKVEETSMDFAARKSQQPDISNDLGIKHIQNGR